MIDYIQAQRPCFHVEEDFYHYRIHMDFPKEVEVKIEAIKRRQNNSSLVIRSWIKDCIVQVEIETLDGSMLLLSQPAAHSDNSYEDQTQCSPVGEGTSFVAVVPKDRPYNDVMALTEVSDSIDSLGLTTDRESKTSRMRLTFLPNMFRHGGGSKAPIGCIEQIFT